jgi:tetratricopeptide (TPR) repeat protein
VTDIFQVQASIAERVAQALDIALSEKEHRSLAQRPTEAFGAYDAFLKGEQLSVRASAGDLSALRQAIRHYRQAVALDPDFVMAWVRLATLHSYLHAGGYGGGTIDPAEANAGRDAAIRALKLRPGGYEGHLAMGAYYFSALADYRRALDEATQGLRLTPNQPELLDVAASAEMSLGLWDSALVHYQREQSLDPRSVDAARGIATVLLFMRHYREALAATNRGLLLDPEDPHLVLFKALIYLGLEDLAGAQKAIGSSPRREGVPVVVLTDAVPFWLLEAEDQRRLVQLGPATFDEDRGTWGSALAQTYWLLGDRNKARIYADSARMTYQAQLTNSHDPMTDALRHSSLGLMLAYLGQAPDAVSQGTRGRSLLPVATNAVWGAYVQYQGAYIYTLLGDPERALNLLEPLVRGRSYLSAGWLQFDPALEALRANPRFKRLIETARRSSG